MGRYLVVHPDFETVWTYGPSYLDEHWTDHEYVRLAPGDERCLCEVLDEPADVTQLVALGVPVSESCLSELANLEEAAVAADAYDADAAVHEALAERGVTTHWHGSGGTGGFWGESVAEHGVGLTLASLRRIPQKRRAMTESLDVWDRESWAAGPADFPGVQTTDDEPFYTHGTVAGKRVRAAGVGNIGSRYLDYLGAMGADVAAHDPYAPGAAFHRIGATRVHRLDDLLGDADVFAPLLPPTDETEGIVDRERVEALPAGCLLVLLTRASVVDMDAVRERVLADELALAADVFDEEPLPPDDPLLGRDNVVHTPHVAGRTAHSNEQWARMLLARFSDSGVHEEPY